MCTVCGCSEGEIRVETGRQAGHRHQEPGHHGQPGHANRHHGHLHHYGRGPAHAHAPGMSQSRMLEIEQGILAKNDGYAQANRRRLERLGVLALNLVSSPGSGKTTLLTKTLEALGDRCDLSVIEGDQETANDADRIRATGVRAVQVNTGKGCHLDAHMVGHALDHLQPAADGLVFIENVGNLVCPAAFDLGEAHKVVILSVTEGEDKPLKYPDMFQAADLMLLNKTDLLPYVPFEVERCVEYARRVNPRLEVIGLSALSGTGMPGWIDWIQARRPSAPGQAEATDAARMAKP